MTSSGKLLFGHKFWKYHDSLKRRLLMTSQRSFIKILGIETSCDDTGCAIVDETGKILGQCLESQQSIHNEHGGILPPIARDMHKENIEKVVTRSMEEAGLNLSDLDAIAATVKPGLPLSLLIGMNYGKMLSLKVKKPFIPIHHMEAHALTIRMIEKVNFPFLVLLISGGHCLLALAEDVNKFLLLGRTLDDAPGEALDKIARRLKLNNRREWRGLCGGKAIGTVAESGNPKAYNVSEPLLKSRDCNFSFAGIKNSTRSIILEEEEKHGVEGDMLLPTVNDLCASVQFTMAKHLCRRLKRGIDYLDNNSLIPFTNRNLVISGGVAASTYFRSALEHVCKDSGYNLLAPPPNLCTDNGAMIAWNGLERFKKGLGVVPHFCLETVDIESKCPFGEDITDKVREANIKSSRLNFKELRIISNGKNNVEVT